MVRPLSEKVVIARSGLCVKDFHRNRPSILCNINFSAVRRARKQSALCLQHKDDRSSYTEISKGRFEGEYLIVNEPVEQPTVPENVALFTCDNVMKTNLCKHKADQIAILCVVCERHGQVQM